MDTAPGPHLFSGPEHEPFTFEGEGRVGALLIHGFPGTPREMRPLGKALADAGITAHGLLLPGFGADIARLGQVSRHEWLAAAEARWAEMRRSYDRTILLGFSLGGSIALQLAAHAAPRRLVLLAPLWRPFGPVWLLGYLLPALKRVIPTVSPFGGAFASGPEMRAFFRRAGAEIDLDDPAVRATLRRNARVPTLLLEEVWRVAVDAGTYAHRVGAPTLFVQGLADRSVLAKDSRALALRMAGPVTVEETPADHLIVDEDGPAWEHVRDVVVRFCTAEDVP